MADSIYNMTCLPKDVVNTILVYTGQFRIENGNLIGIIPKDDERYEILSKIRRQHYYHTDQEPDMVYARIYIQVTTRKFFEISVEPLYQGYVWRCRVHEYPHTDMNPTHVLYERIID